MTAYSFFKKLKSICKSRGGIACNRADNPCPAETFCGQNPDWNEISEFIKKVKQYKIKREKPCFEKIWSKINTEILTESDHKLLSEQYRAGILFGAKECFNLLEKKL